MSCLLFLWFLGVCCLVLFSAAVLVLQAFGFAFVFVLLFCLLLFPFLD
jgi:hypothetical protein